MTSDLGEGDQWPSIRDKVLGVGILMMASSIAQRALERMDAMLSETGGDGMPVAYTPVAGVVVTGNEDGAHPVISEINGALVDIGFTVPGQPWVYWYTGPGPSRVHRPRRPARQGQA